MVYIPLVHNSQPNRETSAPESAFDARTDAGFADEATQFLTDRPALQLIAEFLNILRGDEDAAYRATVNQFDVEHRPVPLYLSWWSLHDRYDAYTAMGWFKQRPDIRQKILSKLCGFPAKAGRLMDLSAQANLIELVIESGDRSSADFDTAIRSEDLVVYGQADDIFKQFADSFPKEQLKDPAQHARTLHILTEVLTLFVEGKELDSSSRISPILSHLDFRLALGVDEWHRYIPERIRIEFDKRRILQERNRANELFTTRDEIKFVGMKTIVESFPFEGIKKIFDVASNRVRFDIAPKLKAPISIGTPYSRHEQASRIPKPKIIPAIVVNARATEVVTPIVETTEVITPLVPEPDVLPPAQPVEVPLTPPEPEGSVVETPAPTPAALTTETSPSSELSSGLKSVPPPATDVDTGWDAEILVAVQISDDPSTSAQAPSQTHVQPAETLPPDAHSSDMEILERETAHISDDEFANAPDQAPPPSLIPPQQKGGSSSGLRTMQYLIELQDQYALRFTDDGTHLSQELVHDIHEVITKRTMLQDELRMREVIRQVLHACDPNEYGLNDEWTKQPYRLFTNTFIMALTFSENPLHVQIGQALRSERGSERPPSI